MIIDLIKWLIKFFKKVVKYFVDRFNLKSAIVFGVGLLFVLTGIICWNVYYSKLFLFHKYETQFLNAAKDFYYYHSDYLPKNGNIKTKKLSEVYEEHRLDELKIPGTKNICDLDSWVKVYNDNGNYIYTVYLKCDKFESKVDHVGPEIVLNGEETIYVSLGHTYEELGVSSVSDNKDGKMNIEDVVIDSSKIDTSKVGKYIVTYTAKDKLNNVTKKERIVYVARNLSDLVRDTNPDDGYYKGNVTNNYLQFSGQLFRIIRVNEDGTVLLISADNLNNLRFNGDNYENSNYDKYLTDVYLKIIDDESYLVDADYCVGDITDLDTLEGACSKTIKRKVALLDLDTFNKTMKDEDSFLCNSYSYALSNNYIEEENVLNLSAFNFSKNCIIERDNTYSPNIRPVMTLKSDLIIQSGDGSSGNPYKLKDYEYGKTGEKINTRIIGEYVNFSGFTFRIMDIQDENVVLIAADGLYKNVSGVSGKEYLRLSINTNKETIEFNLTDEDNPGYIINNKYIDYINDTNIIKNKYEIPTNVVGKDYDEYEKKSINAKVVLPKTYDLFSGRQRNNSGVMYLYIDKSEKNYVYNINVINGFVFEEIPNLYGDYSFKPVITIKGDLIIKSGKGTYNKPYYIGK